jgi:alcohol dehydrogenase
LRALVYDGRLHMVSDRARPEVPQGEALIRVTLAGICNTDLEITQGYMGFYGVLGHEFVGVVEEAADRSWIGRRVVGEINCVCTSCPTCLRGDEPHCPNRTTLGIYGRDGALADYCVLPVRNLHRVPDRVSDVQAVFVEPLAAALEITDRVHVRPAERVIVIGDGKLGLLVAQVLRLTGCELLAVGRHEHKLSILDRQGAQVCLEKDLPGELWADLVVDCTGNPGGLALARRLVRPRGKLVLKSTLHEDQESSGRISLTSLVVDEVTLIGSRCGPFAAALRLLGQGQLVDVDSLVESTWPLEEGIAAFEQAGARGALKVLVKP